MRSLASEENAECVVVVDGSRIYGDKQLILYELKSPIAFTLFKSSDVLGQSFALSGRSCPFYIMQFQNAQQASEFLHNIEDSARLIL